MGRLLFLLLLKAAFLVLLIYFYPIGLAPDEAQYWTWSQELNWGYFSKPPAIAWQIFATTRLFGNTLFGIRVGALLIGFILPWVLYCLVRSCGLEKRKSFWAAVTIAFSPLGIYLSFAATTDGGAILFLTLAIATAVKGFNKGPNYFLCGLFILCGALYKWTAFIFWPAVFCFLPFFPPLRKRSLVLGISISLLAFLPTLYWNTTHDFATFRHLFSTLFQKGGEARSGNFFDFFGAQIALLSPVYFVLFYLSLIALLKDLKKVSREMLFAGFFSFLTLPFFAAALFKHMQHNRASFLYPPGFALIAWYGTSLKERRVWLHIGTWLSIVLTLLTLSIVWIQKESIFSQFPLPYRINPFRQSLGWERLSPALLEAGYNSKEDFLLADTYQLTSLLSFYAQEQKRAYFFNLGTSRKNQFSYWPQADQKERGKTGYFVVVENVEKEALPWYEPHYLERLNPYFEKVNYVGAYPLYTAYGKPVKYALIFRGKNYNGKLPPQQEKY